MGGALGCIQVDQSTVGVKEQFGKFRKVVEPGIHCVPWCCGINIAGILSLRVQQLDVRCETKTKVWWNFLLLSLHMIKNPFGSCLLSFCWSNEQFLSLTRLVLCTFHCWRICVGIWFGIRVVTVNATYPTWFVLQNFVYQMFSNSSSFYEDFQNNVLLMIVFLLKWGRVSLAETCLWRFVYFQDNVFVTVVASVQYRAIKDSAFDAYYKLTNPRSQIQSYVFDGESGRNINVSGHATSHDLWFYVDKHVRWCFEVGT